ncbi:Fap system putative outer membrane protein [Pseudomonas synxantha]|nr:Fap system putative outer membrane protein [Pseudomonas synxantha]
MRTAGDGNTAYNNVGINVENGVTPANNVQSGQVLVAGGTVSGDSAAGRVSVSANNGGVQMAIQANHNQGSSLQQIGGGNVLQGTVLTGNTNLVRNITQINVVMNNNGLNNAALNCNLDQLKGLRTLGY